MAKEPRKTIDFAQDFALENREDKHASTEEETEKLVRYIDDNIIGKEQTFAGPFGRRKVVYCDYIASSRSLKFIEDYILQEVLPMYGNTHTTTSVTSMQSSFFREEARNILRTAVNASEDDLVLFAGNGSTSAIYRLVYSLNLPSPPVVFVGPCEHHSNLLPWKEIGSKIVRISETKEGMLDLTDLENKLAVHRNSGLHDTLIGCFSAASNITGILADDIATTIMLHQYGALAFWDYATAAPYVTLDMNPLIPGINQDAPHKDAIFFSGHKFVGGVQSPSILVAKKSLFANPVPRGCGGGSVFFVSKDDHRYLKDSELREEEGTASVVESIRAGMVVKLKQAVGVSAIMDYEDKIVKTVLSFLRKIPEIILLGSNSPVVKRIAIFSIMVRHPRGSYLHHNFVCAVLNDVFGIQARGGCACAGPYAQDLMGIDQNLASHYEEVLMEDGGLNCQHLHHKKENSGYEMLRPGFTRISLPFFMSEYEVGYVLEALKMVATEGWKLLPQYTLNPETGEWRHNTNTTLKERKWLSSIRYQDGKMCINERRISGISPCPVDYSECLKVARTTFNKARKMAKRHPLADQCNMFTDELNHLRWFMLPSEAQDLLLGHFQNVKQDVPFSPTIYSGSRQNITLLPLIKRHNSLSVPDTEALTNKDIKILRQRSESNSPARNNFSRIIQIPSRERCHSLGSALLHEFPSKHSMMPRQRLFSNSSQGDRTDSETSMTGEPELKNGPANSLRYTPDLVYVEGITKELATELKSEIREVIAQVDDVLSESNDFENSSFNSLEKRSSIDLQKMNKRKAFALPFAVSHANNVNAQQQQSSSVITTPNSAMSSISAEKFSKYLVGFTSDVVSEMKSEFRGVVNAVGGLVSPAVEGPKSVNEQTDKCDKEVSWSRPETNGESKKVGIKSNSAENNMSHFKCQKAENYCKNFQSSHDSGINMTERDLSPSEGQEQRLKSNDDKPKNAYNLLELEIGLENITDKSKLSKNKSLNNNSGLVNKYATSPPQWHCPPKEIWRPVCAAIKEFKMIQNGDKILVCISGGKDSLSLLHTLHQYQYYARSKGINFDIGAATVDPGSTAYNPKPLKPYLLSLGIEYFYEEQNIIEQAANFRCKSVCSFCSRMKRGKLYVTARKHGYNVLALGQHLDDISESFLMSAFHNGHLRSMKAHYYVHERDLRIIRPMVYVRERTLKKFAASKHLPIIPEKCPDCFETPKERLRIKQLLAQQEVIFPKLFHSLKAAIKPLIRYRYTGQESNMISYNELDPIQH